MVLHDNEALSVATQRDYDGTRNNHRYLILAFCVLVDSLGGMQYIYGTLSVPIKEEFKLHQKDIDQGGLFQSIGCNFGLHAGFLYDHVGPRPILLFGALLGFMSYFLLYLSFQGHWDLSGNVSDLFFL